MSMARPSELQAIFYVHNQTFNVVIIPSLAARPDNSFISRRHKIYAFILPEFLAMLQILSAGNSTSPFQVHPVIMGALMFGMLDYFLAFMAWLRAPVYSSRLSIAMAVFGSFSLASLVTLLLPHSWWSIKYIFYVLLAAVELHPLLRLLYERYVRRFMLTMRRAWQPNSPRNLLPLTRRDLREWHTIRIFMLTMRRPWQRNSARHLILPQTHMDLREHNNA